MTAWGRIMLLVWLLLIAIIDFRSRKIPNLLSMGALAFALLMLLVTGKTVNQISAAAAVAGFVAGLALTLPGYVTRTLGAGDVKLLAAIGLLLGLQVMLQTWVFAALGVFVLILLQSALSALGLGVYGRSGKFIPYGTALAVALAVVLLFPDAPGIAGWKIDETFFL